MSHKGSRCVTRSVVSHTHTRTHTLTYIHTHHTHAHTYTSVHTHTLYRTYCDVYRDCDTKGMVHTGLWPIRHCVNIYKVCYTKGRVHNGLVTYRTLWHIGYVTQRADPTLSTQVDYDPFYSPNLETGLKSISCSKQYCRVTALCTSNTAVLTLSIREEKLNWLVYIVFTNSLWFQSDSCNRACLLLLLRRVPISPYGQGCCLPWLYTHEFISS